ncbi:MAG: VOC family protein [Pseudomonadota bacterium]
MTDHLHGSVAHFDISGRDGETLQDFYHALLGWQILPKGPGYALIDTPGGGPNGAIVEAEETSITMGVTVKDLGAALTMAVEHGGQVVMPETDNGWVKKAKIADPAGNLVTLIAL